MAVTGWCHEFIASIKPENKPVFEPGGGHMVRASGLQSERNPQVLYEALPGRAEGCSDLLPWKALTLPVILLLGEIARVLVSLQEKAHSSSL